MKKAKTPELWKVGKAEEVKARKSRLLEGLPIEDADHGYVLEIKKNDILGASKADASNCAAARALKRCLGAEARVYLTRTYIKVGKKWQRFITPEAISREITAFDRGAQFEPGEYILNPPAPTQKLTYRAKPTGPKKDKGKPSRAHHVTASVRKMK